MSWIKEFKEFASRGSLVDVAVAFAMGGAFGNIVSSFTTGIVAPFITLITGGVDFSEKEWEIRAANQVTDNAGVITEVAAITVKYGAFINAAIDFLIVAWAMFLLIKAINKMRKPAEVPAPEGPSSTDQLLMEIRDAIKK